MKALKFSDAQIVSVLKQAEDGTSIGEVCRKPVSLNRPLTVGANAMQG